MDADPGYPGIESAAVDEKSLTTQRKPYVPPSKPVPTPELIDAIKAKRKQAQERHRRKVAKRRQQAASRKKSDLRRRNQERKKKRAKKQGG